jgi:hypothetical protein
MNKRRLVNLALGISIIGGVGIWALRPQAADHNDGPAAKADPTADITDVYAWMSADKTKVNLVMDVYPNAPATSKFSDAVLYVFHLNSAPAYGMAATETKVICGFDVAQTISCWVGANEFVTGDASAVAGLVSPSGKTRVFAGLRDDPFFFNLTGFKATAAAVATAASTLTFDTAGCPMLSTAVASTLVAQLGHGTAGAPPANDFAGQNVHSIVISVDTSLITPGGKILGVWASTHKRA